jgi:hypothetical protein
MAADIELREEKEKKEEKDRKVFDSVFLFLYLGPVQTPRPPNGGGAVGVKNAFPALDWDPSSLASEIP